jgi:hypothetical protein
VDIFIIRKGFRTLLGIIIVDPTYTNMVQQTLTMTTHAMMMVA